MRSLRLILGSIFLVLFATFAMAQTGSIQGTVTDSVGAVVQGGFGLAEAPPSRGAGAPELLSQYPQ